jgi:uncharacterized cupredoxin-like copper-binding protein
MDSNRNKGTPRGVIFLMAALVLSGTTAWAHDGSPGAGAAHDYSKARETRFGKAADPKKATRVIAIDMHDAMRYDPAQITVKRGETVRFVAKNSGKVMHEMVLGTKRDLQEHAAMMKKHPGMEHDEPNMLHVPPGQSGEMGWSFTKAGEFYFGCLEPGHFEAGMVGRVVVEAK